ncbi:rhodanese-like domain-containing protein, partial [Herbaspirillum frisingense]
EAPRALPVAAVTPQQRIGPQQLKSWLDADRSAQGTVVIDLALSARYVAGHIPGAWFALRSEIAAVAHRFPAATRFVLTCGSALLAQFAVADLQALVSQPVFLLEGGNAAWAQAGLPLESGEQHLLSPRIDRYRRPYEGTDNAATAMQAYLDWEFGLVEQLGRDGTHGFFVI